MGAPSTAFADAVQRIQDGSDPLKEAESLLDDLTDTEKQSMLHGNVDFWPGVASILADGYTVKPWLMGQVKRVGIPGVRFTDGPRGVTMGESTAFPVSMARGATWDPSLEERVGHVMGVEARAQGANYSGGVCINLPRHPAWGRAQETYGEDPLLLGAMGVALTQGLQRNVMACVKHFALNSMENVRFQVDVEVDEAALHEVYLPHFERCVKAGIASIMSAYNKVNGEWASQNEILLTDILRKQWGFDGFVLSDFIFGHRDGATSLKAGMDVEAPFASLRPAAVLKGLVSGFLVSEDVHRAARNILLTQLKHYATRSHEEPAQSVVFSEAHRDLAREVAERSIVLLKNESIASRPLLPLEPSISAKYALIGRLANRINTGDNGSSDVHSPHVVTPYEGLKKCLPDGATLVLETSDNAKKAETAARSADVAIIIVGMDAADEGEYMIPNQWDLVKSVSPPMSWTDPLRLAWAFLKKTAKQITRWLLRRPGRRQPVVGKGGDRRSLRLREQDVAIIKAVAQVNPRTIVCVVASGAVIMEEWRDLPAAILMSWYGGCEGGTGLANVLFGKANASGRLPYSVPREEDHLPYFDISASKIKYDRWFGQRLLDKLQVEAAFPLGFGLSYTTFELSNPEVSGSTSEQAPECMILSVEVANTGSRRGRCLIQVCGTLCPAVEDFPRTLLLGFRSVNLDSAQSASVDVELPTRPLKRWQNGAFVLAAPSVELCVGQHANDPSALKLLHHLEGKGEAT